MKNPGNSYQGFEVLKHRTIMTSKMYLLIAAACVMAQVAFVIFLVNISIKNAPFIGNIELVSQLHRELAWKWPIAWLEHFSFINSTFHLHAAGYGGLLKWPHDEMGIVEMSAKDIIDNIPYSQVFSANSAHWGRAVGLSFLAWLIFPSTVGYFRRETDKIKSDEHIRGARLITEKDIQKETDGTGILPIGSIIIPEALSRRHLLIAGQTGSGKSTVLMQHLDAIMEARRRALVNDFKGELVERFYRPDKDLILNPLDSRGLGWTIFNELKSKPDLSAIAGSLIPPSKGEDRFWSAAAQDVLRGVMAYCYSSNNRTNAALWRAVTSPIKEIAGMCQDTASGQAGFSYIQDASSKQAAGVIAVLMSYVSWLEYAPDGPFSLRDWAENVSDQITFITSIEEVSNTLKPYLSLFADLAGKRLLALPDSDDINNSIYLVLDEFGNMQRLPSVKRLLTAGRSKGVIVEIGVSELAAIESIYGREDARTIINSTGSKMVMNLGDPDTAKFFSDLAGDEEYWQSSTTYSISQDDNKGGENHSRQIKSRKVILPSEIMLLPVGHGYFMLPGGNPALIKVPWTKASERSVINKSFILRDGLSLEDVEAKGNEIAAHATYIKESSAPDKLIDQVMENSIKRGREEKKTEEVLESDTRGPQFNLVNDLSL